MPDQIELRDICFENVDSVLKLVPEQNQRHFVEPVAKTIAMAFAGINEGYPGFLQVVYYNGEPAGVILLGRSPVGETEPVILQKYQYVYRLMGFFVDKNYQQKGVGKAALKLSLDKLKGYPEAECLPVYLECHNENKAALSLYESCGFKSINVLLSDDNCVLVRFPDA